MAYTGRKMVACSVCNEERELSAARRSKILHGASNVCARCAQIERRKSLPPGAKQKKFGGRLVTFVDVECPDCHKIRPVRAATMTSALTRGTWTGRCRPCSMIANGDIGSKSGAKVYRKVDEIPGKHSIRAKEMTRCMPMDLCHKYWECLTYAGAKHWPGFKCSDGSEPLTVARSDRGGLREFSIDLHEMDGMELDYDGLFGFAFQTGRKPARRY